MTSLPPVMNPEMINSPLFSTMSELEFNAASLLWERRHVTKDETIFNEGDQGEDMFILLSGSLEAFKSQSDGTQCRMFDISPGSFLGEMSIIVNEPRPVTVIAKEDSELMILQRRDFYKIVFGFPMLGIKMLNSIVAAQDRWLNEYDEYMRDLIQWGETARLRAMTNVNNSAKQ